MTAATSEWTIDRVEEEMVECHELWRRSPGAGKWPFAADGPWHLAQPEIGDVAGEYSETFVHTEAGKELRVRKVDSPPPRRVPLSRDEVDRRDRVTSWLEHLPDPMSRAIVHQATLAMWRGESRPPWKKIAGAVRWPKGLDALAFAYRKALALIVCHLNGWPKRKARAMAETWRRYERWQGEPTSERQPFVVKSLDGEPES
jgi:hypothetical protein